MSEAGGEAAGGGADTELKTKTPHVNVGNDRIVKLALFRLNSGGHPPFATLLPFKN